MTNPTAAELIARSNRLGRDPRNTNFAGGNTSAKGTAIDPVTGEGVDVIWVKGSGGDLGTLTESGLAVLRLDRLLALGNVYPGVDREDAEREADDPRRQHERDPGHEAGAKGGTSVVGHRASQAPGRPASHSGCSPQPEALLRRRRSRGRRT